MKKFLDDDFLLETETAKVLYHNYAAKMPIIDYHNHLDPKAIYENGKFENLQEAWLGGDHYKWRALRANGVHEEEITGKADAKVKFDRWAETVPYLIGNPLYSWTHLELQRYFGIEDNLSPKTGDKIYVKVNELLQKDEFSIRSLLKKMNVTHLCTTDDPADSLEYHKKLKEEGFEIQVLPTFRPEKAMRIDLDEFMEYIKNLSKVSDVEINSYDDLVNALYNRIDYFAKVGGLISDHSLETSIFSSYDVSASNDIFKKKIEGMRISEDEATLFKGTLLIDLGKKYKEKNWTMQIHIGAMRNNSKKMCEKLGADHGFDSMDDFNYAPQISKLLNILDYEDNLPKTVIYSLNGTKDNFMLATLAGDFQRAPYRGKVQFGAAWWFMDHKMGMIEQMDTLASVGVLPTFIGMLTDSRSFLSFPRHEYFRRLLCNFLGNIVENGEYPDDIEFVGKMVEDICYNNVKEYIGFK